MAYSNNRKSLLYVFAGMIALASGAVFFWPQSPANIDGSHPEPTAEEIDAPPPAIEPEATEPGLLDPPLFTRNARPLGDTETKRLQRMVAAQEPFPHDVRMDHYKQELWAEIVADPPEILRPGDPELDAEMAYRLYMYFGNCSIAPRTVQHVDRQLERISNRAESATGRMLERLENSADELLNFYELCLLIPPEVDTRMEAVNWMSEAVRLGHEIALVQFYEKAMGFILRDGRWTDRPPLVMLHPGLIQEFKGTARYALSRAMENGHPEAYLAMSKALDDGVIYPRDQVLAFAYARVAEMKAAQNRIVLARMANHKSTLERALDQAQLAEAEELAMKLRMESDA